MSNHGLRAAALTIIALLACSACTHQTHTISYSTPPASIDPSASGATRSFIVFPQAFCELNWFSFITALHDGAEIPSDLQLSGLKIQEAIKISSGGDATSVARLEADLDKLNASLRNVRPDYRFDPVIQAEADALQRDTDQGEQRSKCSTPAP